MNTEPRQRYEAVPGRNAAIINRPQTIVLLLQRAKNPVFVVGSCATPEEARLVARLAGSAGCPVVATSTAVRSFRAGGLPCIPMPAMEISARLADPSWSIGSKEPPHDLVVMFGVPFVISSVIESGLKSFSPHLRVVSLDRYYHPHCYLSFPTIPEDQWLIQMEAILKEAVG
ncbi:MAG: hypothetical protein LUQ25_08400 [Methanoregulaceae archaeon]|nr:hypothetical protein [Methanoregulaceae archaeon]